MTDKEKLEKIVAYLIRRMYAHNQMADIGSTGEIFDEKIENAKYEECRNTLNFIDSLQEEPVSEVWHDASEKPFGITPYKDKILIQYGIDSFIVVRAAQFEDIIWEKVVKWCYLDDILPDNK